MISLCPFPQRLPHFSILQTAEEENPSYSPPMDLWAQGPWSQAGMEGTKGTVQACRKQSAAVTLQQAEMPHPPVAETSAPHIFSALQELKALLCLYNSGGILAPLTSLPILGALTSKHDLLLLLIAFSHFFLFFLKNKEANKEEKKKKNTSLPNPLQDLPFTAWMYTGHTAQKVPARNLPLWKVTG